MKIEMMKNYSEDIMLSNFLFIGKTSIVYGVLAFSFSLLGIVLPDAFLVGNPLEVSGISPEHVIGHIM